jgi:hypothetical protein
VLPQRTPIAELARDGCPPILGVNGVFPGCPENNEYVLSVIKAHPPKAVVLFARWIVYGSSWHHDSELGRRLLSTITAIHEAGVQRIFVMGPAPEWRDKLPKLVYELGMENFRNFAIPKQMKFGLDLRPIAVDQQMMSLLTGSQARFISAYHSLCDSISGCLVKVRDDPLALSTWDYGHLTTPASAILARSIPFE